MKLYSVKFLLTMILLTISVYFVMCGKATAVQWFDFARWLLGLYIAGNVGTKISKTPSVSKFLDINKEECKKN